MTAVQLPPGRELDALVAERVLKLAVGWLGGGPVMFRYTADAKKGETATALSEALPNYSTDIAAAWEIRMKLCRPTSKRGEPAVMFEFHSGNMGPVARFFEWIPGRETVIGQAVGKNDAHAICLAALKALSQNPS